MFLWFLCSPHSQDWQHSMSHPPLFQKEDNTGSNIVNFPAHSALVQSLLVLDRSDGLAKSHGLLAFFTWLLTIATTCSVYTKMLPQAHPSSINEPMASTYPAGVGWGRRQLARRSSHQKMSPDLDPWSQRTQPLHRAHCLQKWQICHVGHLPKLWMPSLVGSYILNLKLLQNSRSTFCTTDNLYGQVSKADHPEICDLPKWNI